jgi:hypothetical protein
MPGETLVKTGAPEPERPLLAAGRRVLEIQARLHRWAAGDPHHRFDDLFNLVADPAFLIVAWDRVRGNKGSRTAGVDGKTARYIESVQGAGVFLGQLRRQLKERSFRPVPVRERMIPKANGKMRRLGIPTVADRVVQASLKLVLEPIFEADFHPCSYGFRPGRRAHDAIAEARFLAGRSYEWVVEGDITACFDEISHPALMDRVRARISDKRVLGLVKAFLKAGILTQDRQFKDTSTGTPQGASSPRCWLTSPCRFWTSTSPRPQAGRPHRNGSAAGAAARARPTTAWCGMRMTSWSWYPVTASTPSRRARRSRRSWRRWACVCRPPRR